MSDKSYGKDSLIEDAIDSIEEDASHGDEQLDKENADTQNDNEHAAIDDIEEVFEGDEISSEEVFDELQDMSSEESSEGLDTEVYDPDLVEMLDAAETDVQADDKEEQEPEQTVGFSDDPLPDDIPDVDDIIDHVDSGSELNDASYQNDIEEDDLEVVDLNDDIDFDNAELDVVEDEDAKISDDDIGEAEPFDDIGIVDDELSDGFDDIPLSEETEEEKDDTEDTDSNFFDAVLDASDEEDQNDNNEAAPNDSVQNADFVLPDDGFDDISDDEVIDIDEDVEIPKDPSLDELSLIGDLDDNKESKKEESVSIEDSVYGSGMGMMHEEVKIPESDEVDAQDPIQEDVNKKEDNEPDLDLDAESAPVKKEKSEKPKRNLSMPSMPAVPWKAVSMAIGGLVAISVLGFSGFYLSKNISFGNEVDPQIANVLAKFEELKQSVDQSIEEVTRENAQRSSMEISTQITSTKQEFDETAAELRAAINALSNRSDAGLEEVQSMNRRALELMDKFVDDTRVAQEKMAEKVYARVLNAVEQESGSGIDPRYIQSLADTQAELEAKLSSVQRRVQTQMNLINVLESENQFLQKRVLSVEAENESLSNRLGGTAPNDQQVYLEVRGQDGSGVSGYFSPNQSSQNAEPDPLYVLKGVFENAEGGGESILYIAPFNAPNSRPVDYRIGDIIPNMGEVLSIEKLKGEHRVPYLVRTSSGIIAGPK